MAANDHGHSQQAENLVATKAPVANQKRRIQSVERALNILELLAHGEMRLKSIAFAVGLNESTCHHLLRTLMERGYVTQSTRNRNYCLGGKLFELGRSASREFNIEDIARDDLLKLNETLGETVHLAELRGTELVTLQVLDSRHAIGVMANSKNKTGAIHATATGKAILAWLPENEIMRIIQKQGLQKFTANTLLNESQLLQNLGSVRRNGYALDDEEFQEGVVCVGAAIRDHAGTVVGSFSCSVPTIRADEQHLDAVKNGVREMARKLSDEVGYTNNLV